MILRIKSSWIFVYLWLMHIKGECHAFELQRYPNGITAIGANDECSTSGLENDPLVLTKITKLHGQEFWTGLGIYTQLTDWIEMLGCFRLSKKPSTVYNVSSPGLCQRECSKGYFGFNKETITCSCLSSTEIKLANGTNLSSCVTKTDKAVLVYKTYNGTIQTSSVENGLCTTLTCTHPHAVVKDASCEGNYNIKGLCEDGMQSTLNKLWGLPQNQTSENCRNQDKLLLHSNACEQLTEDLTSRAWTNVFREKIEEEQTLGERTAIPKFCLSATISDKGEHVFKKRRQNCSTKLEWFVCKNDSTTVENTYPTDVATDSKYGAIIGGSVGVIFVLLIGVTVILCKIRQIGLFKHDTSAKTTNVVFTKSVNGEETNFEVQTQLHVNQGYGLVYQTKEKNSKTNDSYTQVQKVKSMEDTYTERANGEYDHLHNFGGRKPKAGENTYDSNAGVRNPNDPTYDTATSFTGPGVDMYNTYDHSFTNMKTYSDYDVSDSRMQIDRTNYDVHDQAC
ncbi:unnamed protein product [Mytilus coruscus]|uniref:Uncharacterized protein n=1 Tax=Mytilus coruscus TaxID=42192 RepID=A0A6J8DX70_MYTCO|nr:unnamed protein product [Mytilus coruscus]